MSAMAKRKGDYQSANPELRRLVARACDGTLTDSERMALEGMLSASEDAALFYLAYTDIHAELSWAGRGTDDAEPTAAQMEPASVRSEAASQPGSGFELPGHRRRRAKWTLAIAAALMGCGAALTQMSSPIRTSLGTLKQGKNSGSCFTREV